MIIITDPKKTIDIMCNGMIREDGKIIKYDPNGLKVLLYINQKKENLTQELYALPEDFYQAPTGRTFAHSMINYKEHQPLIFVKNEVNKKKVITEIIQVLSELRSIGVNYWDVHTFNFLIKDDDLKTIDLDEAVVGLEQSKLITQRRNLIKLILELYLYENEFIVSNPLKELIAKASIEDFFSQYSIEHLKDAHEKRGEMIDEDLTPLITDLEDSEKVEKILGKIRGF